MKITIMAVVTAGICLLSTPAWAGPAATANSMQIGLGARYGFEMNEGELNPWGVGLGGSVGYTLPMAVYVGANFDYFFGGETESEGVLSRGKLWQTMAEGGYDIGFGDIWVIRPKLGLGPARLSLEACTIGLACSGDSTVNMAMAPGATFILLTSYFKLVMDARWDLIFAEATTQAFILSLGVGY